jgi:hypothetical protein
MRHDRVTKAASRTAQGHAANISMWREIPGRAMDLGAPLQGDDRATRRRRARAARKLTELVQNPVNYSDKPNRQSRRKLHAINNTLVRRNKKQIIKSRGIS